MPRMHPTATQLSCAADGSDTQGNEGERQMIFIIGFALIAVGWPGMLLGGGLMVVGALAYLDGVL